MANILGSLFVDLRANTAEFVQGMSKATAHAEKTGKSIQKSFAGLSNVLSQMLGPLGSLGQKASQLATDVGNAVGGTMQEASMLSGSFAAIGAAGVAGFGLAATGAIELANHAAEMGAKIFEASEVTGLTTANLSGLAAVSKETGEDFNALTDSLGRAGKNLHEALIDPGEITAKVLASVMGGAKNLKALGLEPMDQALQTVLSRIFALNNVGERNLALNALVGRGWMTNVETLQMLAEKGYGPAIEQAKKFGMYFDDNAARQAKQYTIEMAQMKAAVAGLSLTLGQELIPMLTRGMVMFEGITKSAESFGDEIKTVALVLTGDFGGAANAWATHKKQAQDALQVQTDFLTSVQNLTDEAANAAKSQLNLGDAHTKAARAVHEHAKAAKKLRDTWKEMIPDADTIASLMAAMDASKAEASMRSAAKFRLSVQQGTY
ncbi:MAG TPA: hypothetical protein VGX94_12685 [Terriglobia bacterium]|nr:hypothetical protein [Terriglobia bacterium]